MSNGGYWTIMERTTVDEVKGFLNSCDYDTQSFREFMSDKFNKCLSRSFTVPSDFDVESVHNSILSFKNPNCNLNDLRNVMHYLIFHHYMVLWHKIFAEHEYNIMRAKIANYSSKGKSEAG